MTDVVLSTEVDTLTEQASASVVIESDVLIQTVTETVDGDTVIIESTAAEAITETSTDTVYVLEPQTVLIDVAEQGPPGIQGPAGLQSYPGKTIVYTGDLVTEVRSYLDAAKTQLVERRVLGYTTGRLTTIQFYDGLGALTKTRTLTYSAGVLISVTEA